ncbi:MAG: hypothetical protein AUH14_05065 [Candidatus Rokubacteria bacterium 13_2_20CM_69_15_1]|nr:MAG: hypothetical protein AUH14_05065 [Candidatus Rokubacteria bacterium 13_2_20CM_69_15_1]
MKSVRPTLADGGRGQMPVGSTKAGAARLLLIVSRTERLRYAYLKCIFDDETSDVIVDRRVGERRRRQEPAAVEKRRGDRRERDITKDLEISGWALVRH